MRTICVLGAMKLPYSLALPGGKVQARCGLPPREADKNADTARHKGNALNTTNAGGKAVLVTWQTNYALGMAEIDEQHKMLFDIMNRLWDGIVRNARASDEARRDKRRVKRAIN